MAGALSMWHSMKIIDPALEDDIGVAWKNSHLTVFPTDQCFYDRS